MSECPSSVDQKPKKFIHQSWIYHNGWFVSDDSSTSASTKRNCVRNASKRMVVLLFVHRLHNREGKREREHSIYTFQFVTFTGKPSVDLCVCLPVPVPVRRLCCISMEIKTSNHSKRWNLGATSPTYGFVVVSGSDSNWFWRWFNSPFSLFHSLSLSLSRFSQWTWLTAIFVWSEGDKRFRSLVYSNNYIKCSACDFAKLISAGC